MKPFFDALALIHCLFLIVTLIFTKYYVDNLLLVYSGCDRDQQKEMV